MRKVINEDTVKEVVKALTGNGTTMPKNWNRRFKHNRDKMKTGDIFELAEVVRNLSLRDRDKGLSTGEKQMFVKAKKILISELMYAKGMDEEETAEWLDDVLVSRSHGQEEVAREGRRGRVGAQPMSVWAVIAAAGSGERLGLDRPKAFANLRDRPLLAESLERLEGSDWIDSIVVAAPPDWEEPVILLAEELGCGKVAEAVTGGATRAASVARRDRRRARGRCRRARPRRGTAGLARGGDRARADRTERGLGRRDSGPAPRGHGQARRVGPRRRDARRAKGSPSRRRRRRSWRRVLRAALSRRRSDGLLGTGRSPGGRIKAVPGDPRLIKVTEPADLEAVETSSATRLPATRDRRLPHASSSAGRVARPHGRGCRALRRGRRERGDSTRSASPSTSTTSRRPARSGRCRLSSSAARTTSSGMSTL